MFVTSTSHLNIRLKKLKIWKIFDIISTQEDFKFTKGLTRFLEDDANWVYDRSYNSLRTTDKKHKEVVQHIFKKMYDKGDIYKDTYKGLYCTPCESFWTESQLDENGMCPDCHREVHEVSEEAYFFKLSKYQDRLIKYYEENLEFIEPESRKNEMINNFIKPGLDDLCVSRTSFDWGIPV